MTPWNLLPLADRASSQRRALVLGLWSLAALAGAALAAWVLHQQDERWATLQAEVAAAQLHRDRLQQEASQLRQRQLQATQAQEWGRHVQALRQRAQRLDALHTFIAQRWPAALLVHEWRVEGSAWQLQGLADSGIAVQGLLQALTAWGPWQQPPALVELASAPAGSGQPGTGWRFVAQARWQEAALAPLKTAIPPAAVPLVPPQVPVPAQPLKPQ